MRTMPFIRVAIIGLVGALLISQYQNCSGFNAAQMKLASQGNASGDQDLPEGEALSFNKTSLQIYNQATELNLNGQCGEQVADGAPATWDVLDSNGTAVLSGEGSCQADVFAASMPSLESLTCATPYNVHIKLQSNGTLFETSLEMERDCTPVVSSEVASAENQCFLELHAGEQGDQCVRSCYKNGLLETRELETLLECAMGVAEEDVNNQRPLNYGDIAPIIIDRKCASCHGASGGINVETYMGLMEIVTAGDPDNSILYFSTSNKRMPPLPETPLSNEEVSLLRKWIEDGALEMAPPAP